MRSLIKVGISLLLLAFVLIAVSYSMLRTHGQTNPSSAAGRAPGSEVRQIGNGITSVELSGPIDLVLRQGDKPYLKVRGEQRLLGNVETAQDGKTLHIGTKGMLFHHRRPLQVELVLPSLAELEVHGTGDSTVNGFSGEKLNVQLYGSGNVNFNGRFKQVAAGVHGSGELNLNTGNSEDVALEMVGSGQIKTSGSCKTLNADVNGSGDLDAQHMASDRVTVNLKGSGSTNVFARHSAELTLRGSGDIRVYGNPDNRNVSRTGSGEVSWNH
ncbi:head GIN domain-containing protein [Pseudoduganella namucuonensis]|uniref:Putative auto-transporter adhesin, head GIN domain n=1 Tax=Pseudoduganella namucuonensis TaxID=1035707 RepID=A0A1I7HB18_9BURK|nr:head GIN domain-containing protein [Pseudoduganella namucuonensis]SFU57903.1 Putative auto-transporter adhesin, head GIN domain [Pseudoduganella namucuonensis]